MTAPLLPQPGEVLAAATIEELIGEASSWRSALSTELLALDEQVRLNAVNSADADLSLAFVLWRASAARLDEIITARGTGGIDRGRMAQVSALVWSAVADAADGPLARDLPEARVMLDALVARLRQSVGASSQRITLNASVLGPISDRINAATTLAAQLGNMGNQVAAIASRLARLGPTQDPAAVNAAVAEIDAALRPIENDLQALSRSQTTLDNDINALDARLAAAKETERTTRQVAEVCMAKIAHAPHLAIPSVAVLGDPPVAESDADWRAIRVFVDAYAAKLDRVERALALAHQAYSAPLDRRSELRGLLDGYRDMAAEGGLGERPDASAAYEAAHAALWTAPCDLTTASALVDRYQDIVTQATHPHPTPATQRADEASTLQTEDSR